MEDSKNSLNDLFLNKVSNDEINLTTQHKHSEYLYLLFFLLIGFIVLFFLAYNSFKKLKQRLNIEDDPKLKIVNGLIAANGLRAISLIIVIVLENNSGNSPTAWINYVAHVFPSMIFASAYMALISIIAGYYYSLNCMENHIVYPTLRIIVVSGYIIIALLALVTFVSKNFKDFIYFSEFVIGAVYIITSSMIIYYGILLGKILEEKEKKENYDKVS